MIVDARRRGASARRAGHAARGRLASLLADHAASHVHHPDRAVRAPDRSRGRAIGDRVGRTARRSRARRARDSSRARRSARRPDGRTRYSRTTVLPTDRPSVSAALPWLTTSASCCLRVDDRPERSLGARRRRCPREERFGPRTVSTGPMPAASRSSRARRSAARCRTRRCRSPGRRSLPTATMGPGSSSDAGAARPRSPGPRSASGIPMARCAAAGANTSRPWNVRETGCSTTSSDVDLDRSTAPPSASHARESKPLSGPTSSAPDPARTAIGSPVRPHTGIDDRHVDRVVGQVRRRASQRERAAHHVLAGDRRG